MKRILLGVGLALGLAACGSPGAAFVGTWADAGGSQTVSCTTGDNETKPTAGNTTIVEGTDSDIVLTNAGGCNIKYDVEGKVATAVAGQTCPVDTLTAKIVTSILTLSGDGKSFTETDTATVTGPGGSCTISSTSSNTKVGK